jgi:hypothetical protein
MLYNAVQRRGNLTSINTIAYEVLAKEYEGPHKETSRTSASRSRPSTGSPNIDITRFISRR